MLKPAIHLCLVHNTAAANVTPALDPRFKPEEVILLATSSQRERTAALTSVLQPAGVKVSAWPIDDAFDTEHIRDRVLELVLAREQDDIALNASGGTRPMSIAAYEIFQELGKPVFFVHPHSDHVTWIHRRDLDSFDLANQIKLPAFLQAHGARVLSQGARSGVPARLRKLTDELVAAAEPLAKPLATLNWLASRAEKDLQSPPLSDGQQRWRELQLLIERFAAEGVVDPRRGRLHFPSEEDRFFVNGGWLESYAFAAVFGQPRAEIGVQDVGRSVEVVRESSGKPVKNELDIAFLANNRLYIIECKTKRFASGGGDHDTPGADTLYKLDTLKGILGGARASVMLASYHPLSRWDRQRAQDLDIALCTVQQLPRLGEQVKQWLRGV